jgi:predicted PurR-regulated permease PerM
MSDTDDDSGAPEPIKRIPLPQDMQVLLLVGIFGILVLYTLYWAVEVVQPILFAFLLNLLLQPAMRCLTAVKLPRTVAALTIVSLLLSSVGILGFALSGPVTQWVAKAPEGLPRIEQHLRIFKKPIQDMQAASAKVEKMAESPQTESRTVTVAGPSLSGFLFTGTRAFLAGVITSIVLLFFLLVAGDMFLRRLVEIMPTLTNKKQAVDISREIESNISGYLVTVSLMNLGVGVATGIAAWLCGLPDPFLWGTLAFLLNYVPIVGPLCGVAILFAVGLLTFDVLWRAVLPAAIYLAIHFIEGETVTPLLLARRFTLNPVLVIVSLVFWYWMWGVAGAFLAVPMLATVKIVCDRIRSLMALGHFLGVGPRG